jgi:hypothetical protein
MALLYPNALLPGLNVAVYTADKQLRVRRSPPLSDWVVVPLDFSEIISTPAVVDFSGCLWLFVLGKDRKIRYKRHAPIGVWGPWETLPHGEFLDIAVAVYKDVPVIIARNLAHHLFYTKLTATWTPWEAIPGDGASSSMPGVTVANGSLVVVVRGEDDKLYFTDYDGENWPPHWYAVRGQAKTIDAPCTVPVGDTLLLIIRTPNNRLAVLERNSALDWQARWTEPLDSLAVSSHAAAVVDGNQLVVFIKGLDSFLHTVSRDLSSGAWGQPVKVDAVGALDPGRGPAIVRF